MMVVMEYMDLGSLCDYFKKIINDVVDPFTSDEIITICYGVAAGMNHLHKEKLVHRDLASRNVLLSSNARTVPKITGSRSRSRHVC